MGMATKSTRRPQAAAVISSILLAGLLPSAVASAQDSKSFDTVVPYDCVSDAGNESRIEAQITVTAPASIRPGQPVVPFRATVDAQFSEAMLADLVSPEALGVRASASLAVVVAHHEQRAETTWPSLDSEQTLTAVDGNYSFALAGSQFPTVTVKTPGDLSFIAGDLTLQVVAVSSGTTDEPRARTLTCRTGAASDSVIATVSVIDERAREVTPEATEPSTPTESDPAGRGADSDVVAAEASPTFECSPEKLGGDAPDLSPFRDFLPGVENPELYVIFPVSGGGPHNCALATAVTNLRKLTTAMVVNDPAGARMGSVNLRTNVEVGNKRQGVPVDTPQLTQSNGLLQPLDFPNANSTALSFGFMPVTADVSIEADVGVFYGRRRDWVVPNTTFTRARFNQTMRLHNVRVNGVKLDLGPNCSTRVEVLLHGDYVPPLDHPEDEYHVVQGGTLRGSLYVPPFSGCRTESGENLDALLTAQISGPGNYVEARQTLICSIARPNCEVPRLPE